MPDPTTDTSAASAAPATTTGTTTPAVAASPPVSTSPATPDATSSATATVAPTQKASESGTPPPADGKQTQTTTEPPALFALPADMKIAPEAVSKFESAIRPKLLADGKVAFTPQEVVDLFADQARDAAKLWQDQILAQDKAWEAQSKQRFSTQQLASAESAVGFLSSYDPEFRELSKSFKNHPTFVNAMRLIGERLSEDTFELGGAPPAPPAKSRAERMGYAKPKNN